MNSIETDSPLHSSCKHLRSTAERCLCDLHMADWLDVPLGSTVCCPKIMQRSR